MKNQKQIKVAIQNLVNQSMPIAHDLDNLLKDMMKETNSTWCSYHKQFELLRVQDFKLYEKYFSKYHRLQAELEMIRSFGGQLAELNFWK